MNRKDRTIAHNFKQFILRNLQGLKDMKYSKLIYGILGLSVLPVAILCYYRCAPDLLTGIMTAYLAVMTVLVIYWQGQQLKKQLELQVITELYREWNSKLMRKARASYKRNGTLPDDMNNTEYILEYFEKIASYYKKRHALSIDFIWDTIGWHAMRYYYYNIENLDKIKTTWSDKTLYGDFEDLYRDLLKKELRERDMTESELNAEMDRQYQMFLQSEKS
jgi:hypothetical protein